MKTSLHMFNGQTHGIKIPFDLSRITTALPINANDLNTGTIIFGENAPVSGVFVKESLPVVNEVLLGYYQGLGKGGVA